MTGDELLTLFNPDGTVPLLRLTIDGAYLLGTHVEGGNLDQQTLHADFEVIGPDAEHNMHVEADGHHVSLRPLRARRQFSVPVEIVHAETLTVPHG